MLSPRKKKELAQLVSKVLNGRATAKEKQFVEMYYQYFDKEELPSSRLSFKEKEALEHKILQNIEREIAKGGKIPVVPFFKKRAFKLVAAILFLIAVSAAIYQAHSSRNMRGTELAVQKKNIRQNELPPGGNRAVLTLANGSVILLDSAHKGAIAKQRGSRILKVANGQLVYYADNKLPPEAEYNTISTPRGGQYRLTLADGTKVWLNAASSLTFPTAFIGGKREVTLTGEAYFEVVNNKEQPFEVHVGALEIKDLGTHFNVMAYEDEPAVKTTLLEGAVKITDGKNNALLEPGQQAVINKTHTGRIRVAAVNTDDAVAWKNGSFSFHNTDIYEIMRQISRWYDVEVSYEDSLQVFLNGNINRNVHASEVFTMLKLTGEVAFTIQGKKVMVRKQP